MDQSEDWIENLAGAILDGGDVDWDSAESGVDVDDRLLDQLRLLAAVADLHRRPASPKGTRQPTPDSTADVIPSIVGGKYRIEGQLGQGGMGSVYLARHLELGKLFALKLVQTLKSHRPEYVARFRLEAQALGRLNHPNIVQVTDFGVDSRAGPYLVMEYIEGISLSAHLKARRALPLEEALPIFSGVARALDYAHEAGILHRDLKPANVLLFPREASRHDVKILDFGIARFLDNSGPPQPTPDSGSDVHSDEPQQSLDDPGLISRGLTDPGKIIGTLEYIAPEMLKGEQASSSADIYAFGVLMYEVLAGRRPFADSLQDLMNVDFHREPPQPSAVSPSLPKELDRALLGPLQKDPASRPSRARQVVTELRDAWHAASVRRWRRSELPKHVALSASVAILVLMLLPLLQKLPPIRALESQFIDARFALQPLRPPDPRIVLISIDEATLSGDSKPLAGKADEFGILLGRVFDAGARVVAIDLLLPEHWSRSEPFSQLILDRWNNIVLASYSNAGGGVTGPESVRGLMTVALGPERVREVFGFVNVVPDPDGVVRTMPLMYRDERGESAPSFAARTVSIFGARSSADAKADTRLWIDYSVDWTKFHRVSWQELTNVLGNRPEAFRDRVVLVGAEFAGSGDVYRNATYAANLPADLSGLVLQALTLNGLLEDRRVRTLNETLFAMTVCVAVGIAVMAILSASQRSRTLAALAVSAIVYAVMSFLLFSWYRQLWPIVVPAAAFSLAIAAALILRHKLSPFPRALEETTT